MNKKKALFIDRDGTMIVEPPITFQIDSLDKLELMPGLIRNLYKIVQELDYELVMVSNQDGLGTEGYPIESFEIPQQKMLRLLENEGISFDAIFIDPSWPHENKPTRKPGTDMLTAYMQGDYDLANSYVIGDRFTDVQLAANLGAQAIFLTENAAALNGAVPALIARDWDAIYSFLRLPPRTVIHTRKTNETEITITLGLDGSGQSAISTGIGFFDHMLDQLCRHGGLDLAITAKGDLHIDEHHTIEDTGIALGEAFALALKDKRGMERYGFCLPMDDCLAQAAIDFGGRNWIVWETSFSREKVGDMPTEMFFHFFKSFTDAARCNLNIKAEGENEHHKIEAIFKAFAKSVKMAVRRDPASRALPTTKGIL